MYHLVIAKFSVELDFNQGCENTWYPFETRIVPSLKSSEVVHTTRNSILTWNFHLFSRLNGVDLKSVRATKQQFGTMLQSSLEATCSCQFTLNMDYGLWRLLTSFIFLHFTWLTREIKFFWLSSGLYKI